MYRKALTLSYTEKAVW